MGTIKNSDFKILVVDDEPDLLLIAQRLLKKENYDVFTATSGQGCLDAIIANKPDLLLLDVMLPDINGLEICKTIKNNPRLASIYIFLISGFKINTENISEGLELGADGYLIKPIKNRELLARIEAAVRIIKTEKALRESEEKFRLLHEAAGVGIGYYTPEGIVISYNTIAAKNMNGIPEDFVGKSIFELFPKQEAEFYLGRIKKATIFSTPQIYEDKVDLPDGAIWFNSVFCRIVDSENRIAGIQIISTDITERKLAEITLRESQQMLKTVLDNFPGVVFWKDKQLIYQGCNLSFAKGAGLNTTDEIVGKTDFDLPWAETEAQNYQADDLRVMESANSALHIIEMQHQINGNVVWLDTSKIPIIDLQGKVTGVIGVSSDITERKLVENALKVSEEEFRSLAESMPQIVWATRADGWNIYFNQQWVDYTGMTLEESYGHGWNKPFHPDDQQRAWDAWQNAVNNNGTYSIEVRLRRFDGEYGWWLVRGTPQIDENGVIQKWFGTCTDIENIKQAQDELRLSEEYFRNVFEHAAVGKSITGIDGKLKANKAFSDMLGYSLAEFSDVKWTEITHPDEIQRDQELIKTILSGEKSSIRYEKRYIHKDGHTVWTDVSAVLHRDSENNPQYFITTVQDISERKRAEENLFKHSERLRNLHLIDQAILQAIESPETVVQKAIEHIRVLLQCQRTSVGIFDLENKEVKVYAADVDGKTIVEIGKVLTEEVYGVIDVLRESKVEVVENMSLEKSPSIIFNLLQAEGVQSSINVALVSALEMYGVLNVGWENSKKISEDEIEIVNEVANQITIAIEKARLLKETKGYAAKLEQRVIERTAQLESANKEMESFSYSVSHDLRAPLRGIDGFSLALSEDYADKLDETAKNYIIRIRTATQKMDGLIDSLLRLSRISRIEMNLEKVNLSTMVSEIANSLTESYLSRKVSFVIPENICTFGDSNLLKIVFENLLSNAWKFTSKKAETVIEFGAFNENSKTLYFIKDNGVGFDMKYADKLFSAFQRLHSEKDYPGVGVGLTTVQRIIHRHNGKIWAESAINKGTTFYFTL